MIIHHLTHRYEQSGGMIVEALSDINFQIPDGQFIGLIGQTGSGKSTLVQHLNGLLKATEGEIYYNGEDIYASGFDRKRLRSKVGLVFQYPEHQLFETTIFDDVCFGPKNLGLSRKEAELRAFSALRSVGLSEKLYYQSPFDLSGGQKRRAAIAGVLAMKPEILILDEPTAGLDPKGRDEILNLVAGLQKKENMTVLLVSHSMEDVANYVDRILVMHNGRLVMDGKPKQIFARKEELEQMGLAVPQVTEILCRLRAKGMPVDTSAITLEEAKNEILRMLGKG